MDMKEKINNLPLAEKTKETEEILKDEKFVEEVLATFIEEDDSSVDEVEKKELTKEQREYIKLSSQQYYTVEENLEKINKLFGKKLNRDVREFIRLNSMGYYTEEQVEEEVIKLLL